MTEEEISQWATKLIKRYDNVKIIGSQGEWSGDVRQGFMFNPKPIIIGETGPTPGSGACCFNDGTCVVETEELCNSGGGTYQGDGTDCDPNPCEPTGACCVGTDCTITTEEECGGMGGSYQGDDTTCDPNPCEGTPSTGACCVGLECTIETESDCDNLGGIYQGDDTGCDPNLCDRCSSVVDCYPTHISVTATPNGEVGVRGECQIDPPGRATLSSSSQEIFNGDVSLDGSGECCGRDEVGTFCFDVESSNNADCCAAFGSECALFGFTFGVEWCPDTMQWTVCAELGIGGGLTGYCNWPPITMSFFPSGGSDCKSIISPGQTTVSLTLESSDWAFLTFDVEITIDWSGCFE